MRRSFATHPRLALALVAALVAALLASSLPVLDEESYLAIAAQLEPARPYDWWRPWPPWGGAREADAFVYAHPPLFLWWVWLWGGSASFAPAAVKAMKVAAALPWAALLGWSVGRLAERYTRHPWLAVATWMMSPIVVLGLQRGLMPDLMVTALQTFALVAWLEGLPREGGLRQRWMIMGGLALGGAVLTKYPAALLAPLLLLHGLGARRLRGSGLFWLCALGLVGGVEAWLALQYGRIHLVEVLTRAGEIPRGALAGRGLGTLVRLSLALSPLPLLARGHATGWFVAALVAAPLAAAVVPDGTGVEAQLIVALLASAGLALIGLCLAALRAQGAGPDRGLDERLLAAHVVVVVLGVVIGHNFSAPRYLLPAMGSLAVLVVRHFERRADTRTLLQVGLALHGALALGLTVAEHRFAGAESAAARELVRRTQGRCLERPCLFSGEWTFRYELEQAGWAFYTGEAPSGALVITGERSSPAAHPADWVEVDRVGRGDFPLRVVDPARDVGLYGETTGSLPFAFGEGPLEEAVLWQVP